MYQNVALANPVTADAARISQVQNELDTADKGLACLHENLTRLRGRLGSVLRVQPPTPASESPPKPMLVPLAVALATRNEALTQSNRALEDILELLDL